ncbi:MAG: 3'-5' exonuclease, partial [Aeromicrobium sp.]
VLGVAAALVTGDGHADLDALGLARAPGVAVRRRGLVPTLVRTATREELDSLLVERLVAIGEAGDWAWSDTAILVDTTADLEHVRAVLMRAALPVVDLSAYAESGRCLVLATYEQARGLEFERVLLPGITEMPERRAGEQDAAFGERTERLHRRQYVAVTRARHDLWLGYLDQ